MNFRSHSYGDHAETGRVLNMTDKDAFRDRERSLEDEYFFKKEQELVAKLRAKQSADEGKEKLAQAVGVRDDAILADLLSLGFDDHSVALLHLVPLLQVGWADGRLTAQ